MCVSVSLCACVFMCVCLRAYVRVYMCICASVQACVSVHACEGVYVCACMCCVRVQCLSRCVVQEVLAMAMHSKGEACERSKGEQEHMQRLSLKPRI